MTSRALVEGADEIDVVLPYRAWLAGDFHDAGDVLDGVRDLASSGNPPAAVKVIIETGELPHRAAIDRATHFAIAHGAELRQDLDGQDPGLGDTRGGRDDPRSDRRVRQPGRAQGVRWNPHAPRRTRLSRAGGDADGRVWISPSTFRFGASSLLDELSAAASAPSTRAANGPAARRVDPVLSRSMTVVDWSALDAVLFDLDGVLTPTAEIHERAWADMFDSFLADRAAGRPWDPFSAV